MNETSVDETPESQLIQLEKSQASKVPFPLDCPVIVLDKSPEKVNILYSGDVAAVYVSFDHSTGSCHNCYRITSRNAQGVINSEVVSGDRIRYAINCPITVSSKANKLESDEAIEGIIKGFEIVSEGVSALDGSSSLSSSSSSGSALSFLYTVEVTAIGSNSEEKTFRQRGITPEHIRFRAKTNSISSYKQSLCEKTSVVSLDEPKSQTYNTPCKQVTTPKVLHTGTFNLPCKTPSSDSPATPKTPNRRSSFNDANPPQLISGEVSESKTFMKCHPLPQPHPTHYQGDLNENVRLPDFTFITNFTSTKAGMPEGCKACVMCGEVRRCNNGKSTKTKSMKNSSSYSEDSVVIPNQNKGLCTLCDVNIWVIKSSGIQVKWCKGCKVRNEI